MTEILMPPYPADTRAKGWRFELDLERIEQSDTWALAAPEVRPWLLMLWAKSWSQVPCGSLPANDALIAARLGMAPKAFMKSRAMLMRGWWLADDGRLYHDVIAARVLSMLDAKRKEADRKAAYRLRMEAERHGGPADVPRDTTGTDGGTPPPTDGSDATGTSTGTGTGTGTRRKEGKRKPPPAGAADTPAPKGSRLPAEWTLSKPWGDWALARYPHWTADIVRRIGTTFGNHWKAKTGKDATKLDWQLTWENWCDSDITQRAFPTPAQPDADKVAEAGRLLGFAAHEQPELHHA